MDMDMDMDIQYNCPIRITALYEYDSWNRAYMYPYRETVLLGCFLLSFGPFFLG